MRARGRTQNAHSDAAGQGTAGAGCGANAERRGSSGRKAPWPHGPEAWDAAVDADSPKLLCIGGSDHDLRIPFLLQLREHGFRIAAAGTGDPSPFARAGIDYYPFCFNRLVAPRADWQTIGLLSRLFAELTPDIIQTFNTKPNVLVPIAARTAGKALVVRTINGMGWVYSSRSPPAIMLRPVYRALYRFTARSTSASVFQNRVDRAYFERHRMVGRAVSRLIPGSGIDVDGFERRLSDGPSPERLREVLGLGAAPVVMTVARLTRQKGIPTLLDAAALVHQARPDVRFLLVGPRESEGPFAVSADEIGRHSPYVVATGPRSDIPALLRLADVFAFPTEYREGVPRVLLEAALARVPIVTTDMPGCSDIVTDGWSGFIAPPRDASSLAAKILALLEDRKAAHEMARRASDLVRQEFGLALTVSRYAALYTELLQRGRHAVSGPLRQGANDVGAAPGLTHPVTMDGNNMAAP
jgi:glycosyltransferase involved in cell wall biosynthesis